MGMSCLVVLSVTVRPLSSLTSRAKLNIVTVPQHAWVQSGTIRENITFSSKPEDVDVDQVNEIIDACALRPEVEMWPDGDE